MKTQQKKETRQKTTDELQILLKEAKDALFSLRLEKVQRKLTNTKAVIEKRHEIARIMSWISEKEGVAR